MNNTLSDYSTTPYWLTDERLNLESYCSNVKLLQDQNEILIVGGGYTGLSAAITLARAGKQVVVLEGSKLGNGASCRNGGLLGPSFGKIGIDGLIKLYGKEKTHSVVKESLDGFRWLVDFIRTEKIDCELNICGRFRGADHPKHYTKLLKQIESFANIIDFPATPVPKEEQYKEVGSNSYSGGVIYHDDATLQPALLYQGLLNVATKAGVRIFENVPVKDVCNLGTHFNVDIADRIIKCEKVIIATNGYTGSQFGDFRRRIIPIRSAMIATEALPKDFIRSLSPNLRCHGGTERVVSYFRPSPDGTRMLFGGRSQGLGDQPEQYAKFLRGLMLNVYPQLENVKIDYAWSGLVAYTFDHIPHIGKLDGLYYAMGYCGSGVGRANYFGRKLALKLLEKEEGKTSFDDFPFKSRFLYTGNPWFLSAIMRFHAFADKFGL